jgi:hypothetical protein
VKTAARAVRLRVRGPAVAASLRVHPRRLAALRARSTRTRSRNFGPDAKPQRGGSAKAKKKESERPRGPIPLKNTGRSFTLDDADTTTTDEAEPIDDDFATSKPQEDVDEEK